jgi:hypothetical protein
MIVNSRSTAERIKRVLVYVASSMEPVASWMAAAASRMSQR